MVISKKLKILLLAGALCVGANVIAMDPESQGNQNWQLVMAGECGSAFYIKKLLDKGFDVNGRFNGDTALIAATANNHLPAMHMLLDAGAKIYSGDKTAMDYANTPEAKQLLRDTLVQRAKPVAITLECLAKMDGGTKEDGTQKSFNVVSLLSRPLLDQFIIDATMIDPANGKVRMESLDRDTKCGI